MTSPFGWEVTIGSNSSTIPSFHAWICIYLNWCWQVSGIDVKHHHQLSSWHRQLCRDFAYISCISQELYQHLCSHLDPWKSSARFAPLSSTISGHGYTLYWGNWLLIPLISWLQIGVIAKSCPCINTKGQVVEDKDLFMLHATSANAMAADILATQGAKASVAMILTLCSQDTCIPLSAGSTLHWHKQWKWENQMDW